MIRIFFPTHSKINEKRVKNLQKKKLLTKNVRKNFLLKKSKNCQSSQSSKEVHAILEPDLLIVETL